VEMSLFVSDLRLGVRILKRREVGAMIKKKKRKRKEKKKSELSHLTRGD
jgi:hypothetical protein